MARVLGRSSSFQESRRSASMLAGGQEREQRRRDRRHAARRDERRLGALERGELVLECELRRRVVGAQVAHVVVAAFAAVLEGGRLEDRHLHRAADARLRLTGVYQLGLDVPEGCGHESLS